MSLRMMLAVQSTFAPDASTGVAKLRARLLVVSNRVIRFRLARPASPASLVPFSLAFSLISGLFLGGDRIVRASEPATRQALDPRQLEGNTAASAASAPRVPWTTSRVTGSPDAPPPFVAPRVFPQAKFKEPVFIVWSSKLGRYLVGERRGVIHSLAPGADSRPELAFDLTAELNKATWPANAGRIDAVYALAFHPRFAENRLCYVCYTLAHQDKKSPNLAEGSRIARFKITDTVPPRLDPASEEVLLTWEQGGHNGCELLFGPDGFLYISTGDGRPPNPPDPLHTGQDITDLLSSVLRIDVDRQEAGRKYAIPPDNPFIGLSVDGRPARPEIWAYGFRNPWRMSFDRATGQLWLGDVGWELWEMVHRVERGGNYGWSAVEGRQPIHQADSPGPSPIRPPLLELPHTIAASITGGFVYRGKRFPELVGAYVFGDWEFRRLWAARFDGDRLLSLEEITRPSIRVSSFGEDADGELLLLDYDTGCLHTLARNDGQGQNRAFPQTLSATGLFAVVKDQQPAPGVIPYAINSPRWHDGAAAQRWLGLPGHSGINVYPGDGKPMPSQVYWHNFRLHFPQDAVLAKTLSLERTEGDPSSRRPVETQLLHFDGADWRAYTYAWRDDGSDADLMPASGGERPIAIRDSRHPAGQRQLLWRFHDRTQCLQCHSQWPQYAIGFSLPQLNRVAVGAAGPASNQLVTLAATGHLVRRGLDDAPQPPFDAALAAAEDRLADPQDATAPLDARARSYLHANCSHCHRFNGGGIVGLDLLHKKKLAETRLLEAPIRGDFGIRDARVVAPGEPERSTLFFRMAKFGRDRMPHVGAELPDEAGLRLIENWIASLTPDSSRKVDESSQPSQATQTLAPRTPPAASTATPEALAADPGTALRWARRLARGELDAADRARLLVATGKLEPSAVRDLFEGYLPSDGSERKLGPRPRPETITALTGDPIRGKALFTSQNAKCATCHKVGGEGIPLGPELTRVAAKRTPAELLDSLLEPSRTIEPAFAAYQALTTDGRSFAGLLVRRTKDEVVLRDPQNKEVILSASDVERLTVSRASLMPEGLLAGFTPQQAADLLAYLATLR